MDNNEIRNGINLIINHNPNNINEVDEIKRHVRAMLSMGIEGVKKYDIALVFLTDEEKEKYGNNIVPIAYDILTKPYTLKKGEVTPKFNLKKKPIKKMGFGIN